MGRWNQTSNTVVVVNAEKTTRTSVNNLEAHNRQYILKNNARLDYKKYILIIKNIGKLFGEILEQEQSLINPLYRKVNSGWGEYIKMDREKRQLIAKV